MLRLGVKCGEPSYQRVRGYIATVSNDGLRLRNVMCVLLVLVSLAWRTATGVSGMAGFLSKLLGSKPTLQLIVEGTVTESGEHQQRTHLGPVPAPKQSYFASM